MFIRRFVIVLVAAGFVFALPPSAARGADDPAGITSAVLTFDPSSGQVETITGNPTAPPNYQPGGLFYSFCWPPTGGETGPTKGTFTVGVDGTLDGTCTFNRSANGDTWDRKGTATGLFDRASGKVAFHFEGTQHMAYTASGGTTTYDETMVVDATGVPVTGNRASGRVRFQFACTSVENANCGVAKATGTIGFTLVLGPEEAGEPSGAVAGGPTQGDGGSPPVGFIALGAVLAGIAGAAVLEARRRARKPAGLDGAQIAAVTADRFGGFADTMAYGEGAGKAAPGVGKAYEALVVAQAPQATRKAPLVTPDGATAEALREAQRTRTEPPWSRSAGDGGKPPRLTR